MYPSADLRHASPNISFTEMWKFADLTLICTHRVYILNSMICPSFNNYKRGVSGQKPDKISLMTRDIDRKLVMIWWSQWELTR